MKHIPSFNLKTKTLSILVPVFNESAVISDFMQRLKPIINELQCKVELVFVDDGSIDDTCDKINTSALISEYRKVIKLSRNFGKEAALAAGLESVTGDAVIIIDADLQHGNKVLMSLICVAQSVMVSRGLRSLVLNVFTVFLIDYLTPVFLKMSATSD